MKLKSICSLLLLSLCISACSSSVQSTTEESSDSSAKETEVSSTSDSEEYTTSTDPVTGNDLDAFKEQIKDYSLLYKDGVEAFKDETDEGTYVIPGLISTATLKDGEKAECTDMVPQGVAVSEDYLFISAYDKNHECNSVVYVMDKDSHEYLKTVVIDGVDHLGGLAFNPNTNMLWLATKKDGKAAASSIELSDIEDYDYSDGKAISFSHTIITDSLSEDSFMTYYDDDLYLGTFTDSKDSILETFDISSPGVIDSTPEDTQSISKWCQGIAFYNSYIFLSDSDGHSSSYLRVFSDTDKSLTDAKEIKKFKLPERLEQVAIDGDKAYIIFESAANAYSDEDISKIDRVITVDLSKVDFS